MGKKEVRREDIIEALKKIAFGRANHGVELAYLEKATPAEGAAHGPVGGGRVQAERPTARWR